jgi:hypothetical protein
MKWSTYNWRSRWLAMGGLVVAILTIGGVVARLAGESTRTTEQGLGLEVRPVPVDDASGQTAPVNMSELSISASGSAYFFVRDAAGRRTGRADAGPTVAEIPHGTFFEDAIGGEVSGQMQIERPEPGEFEITAIGRASGPFVLTVRAFSEDGQAQEPIVERATVAAGGRVRYALTLRTAPGSASSLKRLPEP